MFKLKEVKKNEFGNYFPNKEDVKFVIKNNEEVFELPNSFEEKTNPLVDVEISLRRCERVGFFKYALNVDEIYHNFDEIKKKICQHDVLFIDILVHGYAFVMIFFKIV